MILSREGWNPPLWEEGHRVHLLPAPHVPKTHLPIYISSHFLKILTIYWQILLGKGQWKAGPNSHFAPWVCLSDFFIFLSLFWGHFFEAFLGPLSKFWLPFLYEIIVTSWFDWLNWFSYLVVWFSSISIRLLLPRVE